MALKLAHFFETKGYLADLTNYHVAQADLMLMRNLLKSDINGFITNGLISLCASINSLNKYNYSWAFIQSYYSLFFFARAFNGVNDYAIVYNNKKPYGIKIQPAEIFHKLNGNSHDVVLEQFKTYFRSDILLANNIDGKSPIDWFNASRNHINYTLNPQTDPNPPIDLFQYKKDIRKWIGTYINDSRHIYTFDPQHCYIAYPLQVLLRIYRYYSENGLKNEHIDEDRLEHFKNNFCDTKGPIAPLISIITDFYME